MDSKDRPSSVDQAMSQKAELLAMANRSSAGRLEGEIPPSSHDDRPSISVVIPVYRSIRTLSSVVQEICQVFQPAGISFEILLIDDASGPETWGLVSKLFNQYPGLIHAVRLEQNIGQHRAVLCGFELARGHLIATIDDDLQHPPKEIVKLWNMMAEQDLDVVYGRYQRKQSLLRNVLGMPLLWWARWAYRVPVLFSPFRLLRQSIAQKVTSLPERPMVVIDQLILSVTKRMTDTPVEHRWRPSDDDSSSYSLSKLIKLAMVIIGCAPAASLRLSALLVSVGCLAGLGTGLWLSRSPVGWMLMAASMGGLSFLGWVAWWIRGLAKNDHVCKIAETLTFRSPLLGYLRSGDTLEESSDGMAPEYRLRHSSGSSIDSSATSLGREFVPIEPGAQSHSREERVLSDVKGSPTALR